MLFFAHAPELDAAGHRALFLHAVMVFMITAAILSIVGAAVVWMRRQPRHPHEYFAALMLPVLAALPLGIGTYVLVCCHHHHVAAGLEGHVFNLAFSILSITLIAAAAVRVMTSITRSRSLERDLERLAMPLDERLSQLIERMLLRSPVVLIRGQSLPTMTVGRLKPRIVVSASTIAQISDVQLEAVLWHEESHARGYDNLKRLVSLFARTLLCWLPTTRWLYRCWAESCELACDDVAVHQTQQPLELAAALLKESRLRSQQVLPLTSSMTGGLIQSRVRRLLDGAKPGPRASFGSLSLSAVTAFVTVFAVMRAHEWVFSLWCLVGLSPH